MVTGNAGHREKAGGFFTDGGGEATRFKFKTSSQARSWDSFEFEYLEAQTIGANLSKAIRREKRVHLHAAMLFGFKIQDRTE